MCNMSSNIKYLRFIKLFLEGLAFIFSSSLLSSSSVSSKDLNTITPIGQNKKNHIRLKKSDIPEIS